MKQNGETEEKREKTESEIFKELIEKEKSKKPVLILQHPPRPDPDSMASAAAIKAAIEIINPQLLIQIGHTGATSAINETMENELNLNTKPISADKVNHDKFSLIIFVDWGDPERYGPDCEVDIVFNHHDDLPKKPENCKLLVNKKTGATSTLVAKLVKDLGLTEQVEDKIFTSLLHALKVDTKNLERNMDALDYEMFQFLNEKKDFPFLSLLQQKSLKEYVIKYLASADQVKELEGTLLVTKINEILPQKRRDEVLPYVTEFLIQLENVMSAVVLALVQTEEDYCLEACIRSDNPSFDVRTFIKNLLSEEAAGGKHGEGAGALSLEDAVADLLKHIRSKQTSAVVQEKFWELISYYYTQKAIQLSARL